MGNSPLHANIILYNITIPQKNKQIHMLKHIKPISVEVGFSGFFSEKFLRIL
jgi:hypothetical protein